MSYRAKSLEIDLLNLAIKVEYVEQQISIAQQNIDATVSVINDLTAQLPQARNSSQSVIVGGTVVKPGVVVDMHQSPTGYMPTQSASGVGVPVVQHLQMQKSQLEAVSGELGDVKNNLQSSMPRKGTW